ncbi:MAG: hypothetical protein LQ340_002132, partial [Diploschistes diacapsis]
MPSPATPRRSAGRVVTKTPAKNSVDIGKPLGPYDNNLVRERVRQWQAEGGGVITTEEPLADTDRNEQAKPKSNGQRPLQKDEPAAEASADALSGQGQPSAVQEKAEEKAAKENKPKSISTPKKRIVSDGHWRRKRSPPKNAEKAKAKAKAKESAKALLVDDGIRIKPMLGKVSNDNGAAEHPKPTKITPRKKKVVQDDGIRVYATPPSSRHPSVQVFHEPNGTIDLDGRSCKGEARSMQSRSASPGPSLSPETQKSQDITSKESPRFETYDKSSGKRDGEKFASSRPIEEAFDGPPKDDQRLSPKKGTSKRSSKGIFAQVIGESKKMFSRTETVYIEPSENPRIDAWLGGVPDPSEDPFVTDEVPIDQPPVEIPAPLNVRSRRKQRLKESEAQVEDPNKIWDSVSRREGDTHDRVPSSRPRRRRAERKSETPKEVPPAASEPESALGRNKEGAEPEHPILDSTTTDATPVSPSSTPRLRRRNARRKSVHLQRDSPKAEERQSSPLKESFNFPLEEQQSNVSSANTESSVEPIDPNSPLKPAPLTSRRPFPSVGKHRLSTILSVDTLGSKAQSQAAPSISEVSDATVQPQAHTSKEMRDEARDRFDPNSLSRNPSKSRLTRHADLISVLSTPTGVEKSIRSARSIRTNRSRLERATIDDVMRELADDETRYMREVRTLVDGVIPVLLSCVLSKTESAIAAGLFSPAGNVANDPTITKPIIDMGICLERLKAWHKRIEPCSGRPTTSASFLTWAQGVHRAYADYLKSWRMGFQDVVVNLASAGTEDQKEPGIQGGLPRNEQGDVTDSNGERVDVAYLLKRPLVRLKYLAKTLRGINHLLPSTQAGKLAVDFQSLVEEARNRVNEERARLEDEAAAGIDPTRARDPRSLVPLTGVQVNKNRRVRARDFFDLTLSHSSGERVDCRVELLLRDDPPGEGVDADLLICEVDGTGRWLLFPPISASYVSSRNGDTEREIVVMIRGMQSNGQEWNELLSLMGDEEQAGFEWVQMLGLTPVPQQISAFCDVDKTARRKTLEPPAPSAAASISGNMSVPATPTKSRTPSPRDIAVPFGEQPTRNFRTWKDSPEKVVDIVSLESQLPKSRTRLHKRLPGLAPEPTEPEGHPQSELDLSPGTRQRRGTESPQTPEGRGNNQISGSPRLGLRRYMKHRDSRASQGSPEIDSSPSSPQPPEKFKSLSAKSLEALPSRPSEQRELRSLSLKTTDAIEPQAPSRPQYHRRTSSVPSMELPTINKIRKNSVPSTPVQGKDQKMKEPLEESPGRTPKKLTKSQPQDEEEEPPPLPPPHRTPSPAHLKCVKTPDFSPGMRPTHRRTSSPLKHEYEPSTATETSSDSDASTVGHDEQSSTSDASDEEDDDSEDGDVAMPLLPVGALQRPRPPPASIPSLPSKTLGPSSSASQAPYKTVPSQPQKAAKTVASIFYWSDKTWEKLHPDECSIAIAPGIIEAYEMTAAHSHVDPQDLASSSKSAVSGQSSTSSRPRPIIALELTPLVPIRRGTALDISIRSPPTSGSKITSVTNNNVMFRSRSAEECEALYALINYSRINNPTYIALQNARATSFNPQLVNAGINRGKTTRTPASSWFGLGRRRSYRASSAPTPSTSKSDSSVNTSTSAFSALKIFKGSSRFSIHRSTILSRTSSSRTGSVYTSSDNSSGSGTSTPVPPGSAGLTPNIPGLEGNTGPLGLSNAKIRLYIRESASKWRDLGSARLTIMRPTNASHPPLLSTASSSSPSTSSSGSAQQGQGGRPESSSGGTAFRVGSGGGGLASPGRRQSANDKRIVVIGKGKGDTLLD